MSTQHDYVIADQAGAAFLADLNAALAAIVKQNEGATAPATTYAYQFWADTTSGWLKQRNAANSAWIFVMPLAGHAEASVASAATTDLGAQTSDLVLISGTANITSFGTADAGRIVKARHSGAAVLTHNGTSLILPGAANITTAAGDTYEAESLGSGNWVVRAYQKADGTPISGGTVKQLQNFTCTQASNILTGALAASSFDYRNATAANGTPVTQANGALTLAIPATSNLGMLATAQTNNLIWAVAYNGGTPVLCVSNMAGGLPIDETGFISPTTIGASSNSASTWYSASAVSANSPYRIVGRSDVVFTTGTGWSTPTLVQPVGGQGLAAASSLGYGQTWQNVTGSRAAATTYYNTTGRPITVSVTNASAAGNSTSLTVNGIVVANAYISAAASSQISAVAIVPPGGSYSVAITGAIGVWAELR